MWKVLGLSADDLKWQTRTDLELLLSACLALLLPPLLLLLLQNDLYSKLSCLGLWLHARLNWLRPEAEMAGRQRLRVKRCPPAGGD
jgi:hypothetical protein